MIFTLEINVSHNPYEPDFRTKVIATSFTELLNNAKTLADETGYYEGTRWNFVAWTDAVTKFSVMYHDIIYPEKEDAELPSLTQLAEAMLRKKL